LIVVVFTREFLGIDDTTIHSIPFRVRLPKELAACRAVG
jgi:hypothetical protein